MLLWQNIDGIEIDRTYVSKSIEFTDNKTSFYFTGSNAEQVITEDWQNVIHSASAAYVCENGGDILEIGFVSSNYIQSHSINSHTICEIHPEMIEKANAFASGKSNVTIITGSWYDNKDELSTYDGILQNREFTTDQMWLSSSVVSLSKSGTHFTYDNLLSSGSYNVVSIPADSYQEISVSPSDGQSYFTGSIYYMPKREF
jgi:hypothetical protein|tara:strand:- start:9765 stop:10367 length:603 start_codon:yes stop_codon:yes gene_type:complete